MMPDDLGTVASTRDARPVGDHGADGDADPSLRRKHLPEVALSGWVIGRRSTMDATPGQSRSSMAPVRPSAAANG